MSELARQSTARSFLVGPVLDADGVAVTDITVGDLKLSKNGGAPAGLNESATLTHRHTGHYSLALTASDLDTVGSAVVTIDDETNAMAPLWITVVEEAVYDAMYAASATGLLPANVTQWKGTAPADLTDTDKLQVSVQHWSLAGITTNITGNLSGSVGSVTGAVGSISGVTFPDNFGDLAITETTGLVSVGTNNDKTGYALTSDYDAAKTAAQVGDEMDLVDAPNETAITAMQAGLSTFDPDNDTVAHVTLVDTCSVNSDMRGTDNAALASTALSTSQWTNTRAGYLDKLNVSGALAHSDAADTYKADVSDITNTLGSPAGDSLAADIAAVKSQANDIEADTQDLQTKLQTVDNNVDAIKAVTDELEGGVTALPHLADEAMVAAQDDTQQAYSVQVRVTEGRRYSVGVVALRTDDGDEVTFSVAGQSIGALTLDDDNLDNLTGTTAASTLAYFEDGLTFEAAASGVVTIKAEVTDGTMLIRGVAIREADRRSGVVEDQGSGTHCQPLAAWYDNSLWTIHVEMYTGDVYLSRDGVPQGKVFDGDSGNRNDHYHNGCAVIAHPDGLVVAHVGHNTDDHVAVRFIPSGVIANISSELELSCEGSEAFTYVMLAVLSTGEVLVLSRGRVSGTTQPPVLFRVSNIDDIGGEAAYTADVIAWGLRYYPRDMQVWRDADDNELVTCVWNTRSGANWHTTVGALFAPHQGDNGRWYSLRGTPSNVVDSLGTADGSSTTRFSNAQRDAAVGSGGIQILAGASGTQRYVPQGALWKPRTYPSGEAAPAADVLLTFVSNNSDSFSYSDADPRWCIQLGDSSGTRYLSHGPVTQFDFGGPTDAHNSVLTNPNNYRIGNAYRWYRDDPDSGIAYLAITNRGIISPHDAYEPLVSYYTWGAERIELYEIRNCHSTDITFTHLKTIEVAGDLTGILPQPVAGRAEYMYYQSGLNSLHQTHVQSDRRYFTLTAGDTEGLQALDTQIGDIPTNSELATAITTGLTTALTEGYRSTGQTGSVRDLLYEMLAHLGEFSISGTTKTTRKLDGSTTAKTYTLDDASNPTSITEAT